MRGVLLAASLVLAACWDAQVGGVRVDPALAALLPGDTVMLAGVRMDTLRTTPLYQKLVAGQRLADLDDFAARTRFDPRKDVREFLVASNGSDSLVLARGSIRPAPPQDLKPFAYKGATLYTQGEAGFAILDSTTAAAGPVAALRKAIDQKQSGQRGGTALLARAAQLPATSQIWAVLEGWGKVPSDLLPSEGNLANFRRIFQSLESTTLHADLRKGVQGRIDGQCRTEQDAKTLSDAVRGLVGFGRLSVPEKQPELLRFWDGIQVEQQQRSIRVNVEIAADLLDQFLKMTESPSPRRPRK